MGTRAPSPQLGGAPSNSGSSRTASEALESALRRAVERARERFPDLTWQRGYTGEQLAESLGLPALPLRGFLPDGGVWFGEDRSRPLVAFEAKRQGATGNAIERWFKNHSVYKGLSGQLYVTFCSGDGFFENNPPQRTLETALALDPLESARIGQGTVWNQQVGNVWLYRYRDFTRGDLASLEGVVTAALTKALSGE